MSRQSVARVGRGAARAGLYMWASPATLLGLLFAPVAWASGGRVGVVAGVVEIDGGLVATVLRRLIPLPGGASALTLGHVVLGRDPDCLTCTRDHERVHVRQYERWGPLFIPLYLFSSIVALLGGGDPYRDNRFEREAYGPTASAADRTS